jgi:hypothetical protein
MSSGESTAALATSVSSAGEKEKTEQDALMVPVCTGVKVPVVEVPLCRPPPPAHKYLQRRYILDVGGPGLDQWVSSHGNGSVVQCGVSVSLEVPRTESLPEPVVLVDSLSLSLSLSRSELTSGLSSLFSGSLCVIGLCDTHPALRLGVSVTSVDFAIAREKGKHLNKRVNRMVHSNNSTLLQTPQNPLCTVKTSDGQEYVPQSCVNTPCLLLECNPALKLNPALLTKEVR